MKNPILKFMLFVAISLAVYSSSSAQVFVKVRPVAPVVVQTGRPSPNHVWVGEEWHEDHGGYKYAGGHWAVPPHPGERWIPGHWGHEGRGEFWVSGHWGGNK
jgi:hypothetical protein